MTLYTISKDFQFSASHQLAGLPGDHPCSRVHGHNYTLQVGVEGTLDRVGFVMDYRALAPVKRWVDDTLDHRHINDLVAFNPTSEHLVEWIAHQLGDLVAFPSTVHNVTLALSETPKTWARATWPVRQLSNPMELDRDRYRWDSRKVRAA